MPREMKSYRQSRFTARFPTEYLYTEAHFWLSEQGPRRWRIGLTSFGTRMLGEIVELEFEVEPGTEVIASDLIGWIEGFKATSDLYCVATGRFAIANPRTLETANVVNAKPYEDGWLYEVDGDPDPNAMDVHEYIGHLDRTIGKLKGSTG